MLSAPTAAAEAGNATSTDAPAKTVSHPATVAPSKDPPAPSKGESTKSSTNDVDDAPMADNYIAESVDKLKLASTLDRITKVLDANPSSAKGTAAVPLLPGKNYDFFLLKVPKRGDVEEKPVEKPPQKDVGRNLDYGSNENSLNYPGQVPVAPQAAPCLCSQPPPLIAPDLTALQSIFGNALSLNTMLDPACPPGLVPVIPNSMQMTMRMMPAIDGIPRYTLGNFDFNNLGQNLYNQYNQNSLTNSQQPTPNFIQFPNQYSAPNNVQLAYPQNAVYPQNGGLVAGPVQYPPPQIQPYQPFDQTGLVPYGQNQVNAPYGVPQYGNLNDQFQNSPPYDPSPYQPVPSGLAGSSDFAGGFAEYNRRNDLKSATKSLFR